MSDTIGDAASRSMGTLASGDGDPTTAPTVRSGRRGVFDDIRQAPRTLRAFVVDGAREMFVEPFRSGRPRLDGRPPGTRAVIVCGIVSCAVCLTIIAFGGPLRAALDLSATPGGTNTLSLPRGLLWLVVALVVIGVSLLQAGALHAPVWLRSIVAVVTVLTLVFVSTAAMNPAGGISFSMAIGMAGGVCLVVLQALRWRAGPQWWEFVVVLGVVTVVVVVAYSGARSDAVNFGLDTLPGFTSLVFFLLGQLAIPMSIAAGIGAAEVGVATSTWTTTFAGARLSFLTVGGLALALGIIRSRDALQTALVDPDGVGGSWHQPIGAVLVAGLVVLVWRALDRLADRHDAGSSGIEHIISDTQSVALPVAVGLSVTAIPAVILRLSSQVVFAIDRDGSLSTDLGRWADRVSSETTLLVTRVTVGVVCLAVAVRWAARGRRGPAELLGVIGLLIVASYATQSGAVLEVLSGWDRALDLVGMIVIVALVLVRLRRRTITPGFLGSVLLLLMLTVLLTQRDFVSDPLSLVLGFAGIGFLLFGYVWTFLTGAESANTGTPCFPRDSRMMLFTALNLFGVTVLAWAALTRSTSFGTDLGPFAELGDQVIGVPIIVTGFVALVAASTRDEETRRVVG
jgi:hypothetical protein